PFARPFAANASTFRIVDSLRSNLARAILSSSEPSGPAEIWFSLRVSPLAEQLGGWLRVAVPPSDGTTFTIRLWQVPRTIVKVLLYSLSDSLDSVTAPEAST